MRKSRLTLGSFLCSLTLHGVIILLLVVGFHFTPAPEPSGTVNVKIVKTVAVQNKQVQAELNRLKDIDRKKKEAEQQKEQAQERKLAQIKKQQEQAEQKREQEQKRLADLKQQEQAKQAAAAKKLAEIKAQQEQAEKQRKEEEAKRAAAELKAKKEAEAKRKAADLKAKKEAEAKRQADLQKQLAAEQAQKNAGVVNSYINQIKGAISNQFNISGLPPGLSCVLHIRMVPGGDVVSAQVVTSSGNSIFDRRAEIAVTKASPLPVPDDPGVFEMMRDINLTFAPNY